jgi:thioredoxin-like negative regulator of GroEL
MRTRTAVAASLAAVILIMTVLAALAGCGGSDQPKVMVFLGKSSKSYDAMKPVVDKLQKQYEDKVTWVNVDYDDPANKGELEKYHVSMNPTVIIFNTKGEIKETFMGAAREDMLSMSIESYLPSSGTKQGTQPGTVTAPGTTGTSTTPMNPLPGTSQ